MSKYKIGDKVQTPLGIGVVDSEEKFDTFLDEWHIEVVIGEKFSCNSRVLTFETKYLEQYKTAHEKLIDMGFKLLVNRGLFIYEKVKDDVDIIFDIKNKNYIIDKTVGFDYQVDLELSKVLTQYLEELE